MSEKGQPPAYSPQQNQGYVDPHGPGYGYNQPMDMRYGPTVATQQNTIVVGQPAPQSTVIVTHASKPPNFLALAIFVCLICNCLLGMIAIVFSVMSDSAYSEGNVEDARSKGRVSMWISVSAMILSGVLCVILIIFYFTGVYGAYGIYYG